LFERILVAVAEAEDVEQTMATVTALAKAFSSEVVVFHARERLVGPDDVEEQETIPQSQEYGERMATRLEDAGIKADVVVESVRPNRLADHILAHAEKAKADLIVIGGHHPHNLRETIFGDIGKALVHGARCPVLLMPSTGGN
jgi:nucleotide-binding universal stress UspA family protein